MIFLVSEVVGLNAALDCFHYVHRTNNGTPAGKNEIIQEKMEANQARLEAKIGTDIKAVQDKMDD
jgi:hypothetical protein